MLFFGAGTRYVFGLALTPMTEDLSLSRSALSSALTMFMLVSALAMPMVGRSIDRYGVRIVMSVGVIVSAVAVGAMGAVSSVWHVFALYGLLYAVGFAATSVAPVSVLMSRWFPNNTGLASGVAITGNGAGQLVIISALSALLSDIGWRRAYIGLGIINAAVVAPLVLAVVRTHPPSTPKAPDGSTPVNEAAAKREHAVDSGELSIRSVMASRHFWLLITMFSICGFQDFFVSTHVVAFAQDSGVDDSLAGSILAFMGLAALIGVLMSGAMADRLGAVRPTLLCFILRIGLFAYILFMQDTVSITVVALIYGFTFTMTAPLTVVFAANMFGRSNLGSVSGLVNMTHQIAGGIGALTGAIMFDLTGSYDGAFLLMFALSVLATVVTAMIQERPRLAIA